MSDLTENLGARTATGAAWMAIQTAITRVLGLFFQLVLTWLLVPEDFGRLGLVWTISAFATQLIDPGIDEVLLQRRAHFNRWATPAFWMVLTCSVVGGVVMVSAAFLVTEIASSLGNQAYGDPALVGLIAVMALAGPLNALGVVPAVRLRADMRFLRISALGLAEFIVLQGLTILLAALGCGAYSLVVPFPIVAAGRAVVLWLMVRPRVGTRLHLRRWPSLIGSTRWVFGMRLLQSFTNQGDYMFLGIFLADQAIIGQYFFAYMLSVQMTRMIGDNLTLALTPALNALHHDVQRMEAAAIRAMRTVATIAVPLAFLQILLAGPVVRLLFQSKWEPAIPLLRFLSFGMLLYGSAGCMQAVIAATGRFRAGFFMRLGGAIAFALIVGPLTWRWRETGTAIGVSLWFWVTSGIIVMVTFRSTRGLATLLRVVTPPLLASVPGAVAGAAILSFARTTAVADITATLVVTLIVLGSYAPLLRLIDRTGFDILFSQLRVILGTWQAMAPRLIGRAERA